MNFLQTHPDTERWWAQREKCLKCKHCDASPDPFTRESSATVMRCRVTPTTHLGARKVGAYCIDARLPDQPCGPDAALFKEKT